MDASQFHPNLRPSKWKFEKEEDTNLNQSTFLKLIQYYA